MEFDYKPGKYKITECATSRDGELIFVGLENGMTITMGGRLAVPLVGDELVCQQTAEGGLSTFILQPQEPLLRVNHLLEEWQALGVQRLRRLSYELEGFNHISDDEQMKIFLGLQNATAVGMFIEQCKFKNAYKHERKYTRAIREVARDLHLLD